jgi:hypothetical protein
MTLSNQFTSLTTETVTTFETKYSRYSCVGAGAVEEETLVDVELDRFDETDEREERLTLELPPLLLLGMAELALEVIFGAVEKVTSSKVTLPRKTYNDESQGLPTT